MKESAIQKSILDYLKRLPKCRAKNNHGSAYSGSGEPDITALYRGRFLAIEVKRPGEKPTRIQEHVLQKYKEAGAITLVAESVDDVRRLIKEIDNENVVKRT